VNRLWVRNVAGAVRNSMGLCRRSSCAQDDQRFGGRRAKSFRV